MMGDRASTIMEQSAIDEMAHRNANDEHKWHENKVSGSKNKIPVPFEPAPFLAPRERTPSSLKNTQSGALLEGTQESVSATRTTTGNRVLNYIAKIIQQPERAKACGSETKASSDLRPVDPPPTIELRILELKNGLHTDVTFSYDASFFMYATLEHFEPIAPNRGRPSPPSPALPVLTGMPVSGPAYLDPPFPAIYFIFPDLSVRHEGKYRLCFTLFEEPNRPEDQEVNATQPGLFSNAATLASSEAGRESVFHNRLEIKSNQFTVFNAKKFPGIAKSTVVSKTLAEPGCRVRIRRTVRMKRVEGRDYGSGDYLDGSPKPMQSSSPQLGVPDEKFRHKSAESSEKEKMTFLGGDENLIVRQLPQVRPIASYMPGPAPTSPPMPMATEWSPREKPRSLGISKETLKNHSADLNLTVEYPVVIEKENTQLPEVSGRSVPEASGALSHSEVASARNKNVSANNSMEKERRIIFDDAASKKSSHELSLPIMDVESIGKEHDQGHSQTTLKPLVQPHQKTLEWDSIKDVVSKTYITDRKSLHDTMFEIEKKYGFRASTGGWRQKLKQWGFVKNLSASNMPFMIAKSARRHREEGKATAFFHKGSHIPANKLEAFRKRRNIEESDLGSSRASTPESVTYCTPPSDTDSMAHSDKTIAHDVNHDDVNFLAFGSPAAVSREEIWSTLGRCMWSGTGASSLGSSTNETVLTQVNDEPISHKIKRSCQGWWLANATEPWENILPNENLAVFPGRQLLHLIFSSWHQDWMSGSPKLRERWCWLWSIDEASEQEDLIVEKLVHDISVQLGGAIVGHVKTTPAGSSGSNEPSESASCINSKSFETSKSTGKRRDRSEAGRGDDNFDEDGANQNNGTKRRKRSTDDLNRYVICTQYAAGRDSVRSLTKCFFGAWCSVDRLKQDHLIKVHNFESSQMQIDRGGTESEKWWRLFDKLNPGFRVANPEKFIPGPFYEDRVAHNTYNKIFSEAMKRTERIQQRRAQNLASDIQSLLNRHQNGEMQEIRQVVLDVLHSRESDTFSNGQSSTSERTRPESNNFHTERGTMSPYILQQPESSNPSYVINDSTLAGQNFDAPGNANSFDAASLPKLLSDVPDSDASLLWQRPQLNTSITTSSSSSSFIPDASDLLGIQYGAEQALDTITSSETVPEALSAVNNLGLGLPRGKICRCKIHNTECDQMVKNGYEFCSCCSGWFSWSAFAEPFLTS